MDKILDTIKGVEDLHRLKPEQLNILAKEIRELIIDVVAKNGGHLAPNLGVVELTIALHHFFNSPRDKIIWDVGHQSYVHKILTGRKEEFSTIRLLGGISGFPKREESEHDVFDTGHSSTSISAALGIAFGRDLNKENYNVIAVIGDGSLTGGMAFEALNHAGHSKTNLIVVLNDNEMSIAANVGALALYLSRLRFNPTLHKIKEEIDLILRKIPSIGESAAILADRLKYLVVPGVLFEELGFTYLGPVDGHNIPLLKKSFQNAVQIGGPVLIHVLTRKGKGFRPAEENSEKFHGIGPFNPLTGEELIKPPYPSYTEVFGQTMLELAAIEPKMVAVTAAMCIGTGLSDFARHYPSRIFDVGIAEQHAVTFAAGLATQGFKPVVAIYSTFLQRAYDQIAHDVCMQKLPVVFALDRSGIVGQDGPTHHGVFDIAYLRHIPNMVIAAPKDGAELRHLLYSALNYNLPVAIRYPKDHSLGKVLNVPFSMLPLGKGEVLKEGRDVLILAVGSMVLQAQEAAERLAKQGISCTVVNMRFIKPLDEELLTTWAAKNPRILTVEEHALAGGFGSAVMEFYQNQGMHHLQIHSMGLPDEFIPHGPRDVLLGKYHLNAEGIIAEVRKMVLPSIGFGRKKVK